MNSPEIFTVIAAIKDAYKSLERPDFSFVGKATKKRGYARLLAQLERRFDVRETTDENDDVAFVFLLSKNSEDLGLWLSMVGPYALVQRVKGSHIEALRGPYSAQEAAVLEALSDHRVMMISESLLRSPIRMELPDAKDGKATIYQALFDNSQVLPWGQQEWTDEPNDEPSD